MLLETNIVSYYQGAVHLYFLGTVIYYPYYLDLTLSTIFRPTFITFSTKINLKWEELFRPLE
jgi:hypothetical protein